MKSSQGIDNIVQDLARMKVDCQVQGNPPMTASAEATALAMLSLAATSFSSNQATQACNICKEKEITPPSYPSKVAWSFKDTELDVIPTVRDTKSQQVRKWKLKHHRDSIAKFQPNLKQEANPSHPKSPPPKASWSSLMFGALNVPALPVQQQSYLQSPTVTPKKQSSEDTALISMPALYLTPEKSARSISDCPPPTRKSTRTLRRRPIGRQSPLHKKLRRDDWDICDSYTPVGWGIQAHQEEVHF